MCLYELLHAEEPVFAVENRGVIGEGGGSLRDGPRSAPREGQPSPLDGPDLALGREGRA